MTECFRCGGDHYRRDCPQAREPQERPAKRATAPAPPVPPRVLGAPPTEEYLAARQALEARRQVSEARQERITDSYSGYRTVIQRYSGDIPPISEPIGEPSDNGHQAIE